MMNSSVPNNYNGARFEYQPYYSFSGENGVRKGEKEKNKVCLFVGFLLTGFSLNISLNL